MYRTGDAARYRADGRIEFLGRVDEQVKVRGFRIEPGEIEACLRRRADVSDAVVVVREDVADSKRIVAYVVPRAGALVTVDDVREQLKMELPDYLVPAVFVLLDSLPLTPNGKVDRRALPEPRVVNKTDELPPALTPTEEKLAEIWSDILSVSKVGLHDNFFEIGGHSLLATRTVARICDVFRVELPLECLFESPTIAAVAARIEAERNAGPSIQSLPPVSPRVKAGPVPLSYAQERLWFLFKLDPANPAYNIPAALKLTGLLKPAALIQSLNEIVRRHEILRTRFDEVSSQPVQIVTSAKELSVPVIDLSALSEADAEASAISLAQADARRPFDLTRAPLIRLSLLRMSDEVHILLLNIHHIVFDGWSLGVFIRELATLYEKFSMGEPSPLPELNIQYADYTIWQREWLNEAVLAKQLAYWKRQLGETPSSWEMPTDHPRPAVQTYGGVRQPFRLPGTLIASLNDLSRRTETHCVPRFVLGQNGGDPIHLLQHQLFWLADTDAADGVPVEVEFDQFTGTTLSKLLIVAALHDAKNSLISAQFPATSRPK